MSDSNVISFPKPVRASADRQLIASKLKDARKERRLTQGDLGDAIGVSRQAVSAYERGDKHPDAEVFARICETLDQPASFFTDAEKYVFGIQGAKFFRKFGADTLRRNEACTVLGEWFVQVTKYLDGFVNFPQVNVPEFAPSQKDGNYTIDEINDIANKVRGIWGLGSGPISNVLALLESKGIITSRYEIENDKIEAFSFWNGNRPFILMASQKEAAVRRRFDLAHELGHLVLHKWVEQSELENKERLKIVEREANIFAGAFLLPDSSFPNEIYTSRLEAFIPLKARWKVSIQAMVHRCHALGIFDEYQTLNLRKQISFKKWRTSEPLDNAKDIALEQPKLLSTAANLLLKSGKHPESVVNDLRLRAELIESFYALPLGTLNNTNKFDATTTLKNTPD